MRFAKTLWATAGLVSGLALGFLLGNQPTDDLQRALAKSTAELSQTQEWLRQEMQWSDERHDQTTAQLAKALADLGNARSKIAQMSTYLPSNVPSASPRQAVGGDVKERSDLLEAGR